MDYLPLAKTTAAFRDNYEPFLAWMKTPEGKSAGFGSEGMIMEKLKVKAYFEAKDLSLWNRTGPRRREAHDSLLRDYP